MHIQLTVYRKRVAFRNETIKKIVSQRGSTDIASQYEYLACRLREIAMQRLHVLELCWDRPAARRSS
eukprot:5464038-Pleurochrysis_carterae.AAC.2